MNNIDKVLDSVMQLDYTERELLLEILQRRQTEARRKEIARNAGTAKTNFANGKIKTQSADEIIKKLNSL